MFPHIRPKIKGTFYMFPVLGILPCPTSPWYGPPVPSPNFSKVPTVTGMGPLRWRASELSSFLTPQSCHPCNGRHFGLLMLSSRLKRPNNHRDGAPYCHDPCNCHHFLVLASEKRQHLQGRGLPGSRSL